MLLRWRPFIVIPFLFLLAACPGGNVNEFASNAPPSADSLTSPGCYGASGRAECQLPSRRDDKSGGESGKPGKAVLSSFKVYLKENEVLNPVTDTLNLVLGQTYTVVLMGTYTRPDGTSYVEALAWDVAGGLVNWKTSVDGILVAGEKPGDFIAKNSGTTVFVIAAGPDQKEIAVNVAEKKPKLVGIDLFLQKDFGLIGVEPEYKLPVGEKVYFVVMGTFQNEQGEKYMEKIIDPAFFSSNEKVLYLYPSPVLGWAAPMKVGDAEVMVASQDQVKVYHFWLYQPFTDPVVDTFLPKVLPVFTDPDVVEEAIPVKKSGVFNSKLTPVITDN